MFLNFLQYSQANSYVETDTPPQEYFSVNIAQNSEEHALWRTFADSCFWNWKSLRIYGFLISTFFEKVPDIFWYPFFQNAYFTLYLFQRDGGTRKSWPSRKLCKELLSNVMKDSTVLQEWENFLPHTFLR